MRANIFYSYLIFDEAAHLKESTLLDFPLISVLSDLKKIGFDKLYLQCPAVADHLKNTFAVRAPFNFDIKINPKSKFPLTPPPGKREKITITPRNIDQHLYNMHYGLFPFSSTSIELTQLPANYHINDFTRNTTILGGKFNINKWYRPLIPTFILHKPEIRISRGDVLYYIKINSNKKVNLKSYSLTPELRELSKKCLRLKKYQLGLGLKTMYKLFTNNMLDKKILKEINQNIINL